MGAELLLASGEKKVWNRPGRSEKKDVQRKRLSC